MRVLAEFFGKEIAVKKFVCQKISAKSYEKHCLPCRDLVEVYTWPDGCMLFLC